MKRNGGEESWRKDQGQRRMAGVGVKSGVFERVGQEAEPRRSVGASVWPRETWTEALSTALGGCGHQRDWAPG